MDDQSEVEMVFMNEDDSPSVGGGVSATREFRTPKPDKKKREVSMDAPKVWKDKPSMPFQFRDPEMSRLSRRVTMIFNLAEKADLDKWNELQSRATSPSAEFIIANAKDTFCPVIENWKIMTTLQYFEFRDVMAEGPSKKKSNELESN